MIDAQPAPGRRVRYRLDDGADSNIYCALYLPKNWKPENRHPVIVEFPGNLFFSEPKKERLHHMKMKLMFKNADGPNKDGTMTREQQEAWLKDYNAREVKLTSAEEALWNRAASNGGYHYSKWTISIMRRSESASWHVRGFKSTSTDIRFIPTTGGRMNRIIDPSRLSLNTSSISRRAGTSWR